MTQQSVMPGSGLERTIAEALRLEQVNPAAATMVWRQALDQLSPDSPEFQQIYQRIGALAAGWSPQPVRMAGGSDVLDYHTPDAGVRPPDPLPLALAKTIGSMVVSAVLYYFLLFHNVTIAIGFVVLMLIHEMGHVFATWHYKLSASPPIFIPFMGALINLRENPPNALVESVIGMGGPLLGTIGALACYALAAFAHGDLQAELIVVAQLAFMLNLFNMLPVPPLDGGRITAAVSPWIWIAGLAGLGVMVFNELRSGASFGITILLLVLVYAVPRIVATLRSRGMKTPYYDISPRASWTMGILYVGLGLVLVFMFHHLNGFAGLQI